MFLKVITAASMLIWVPLSVEAKAPANPSSGWQDSTYSSQPKTERHTHHYRRLSRHNLVVGKKRESLPQPSEERLLRADIAALRRELVDIRAEVGRPREVQTPLERLSIMLPGVLTVTRLESPASLPDLRLPTQPPAIPEPLSPPFSGRSQGVELFDEVKAARVYLVQTATIGYTMARQGVDIAIGRLHPDFVVKLQDAIRKARNAGLSHAGVFSAYRPPAFGVGGFGNKFNSLHSYGLAVDMTGIGGPGSSSAHLWSNIVKTVGLYLPYGPNNRAEYNHTQLVSTKVAPAKLRTTITASAPKDVTKMWAASGVIAHMPESNPVPVATADKLPFIDWGHH